MSDKVRTDKRINKLQKGKTAGTSEVLLKNSKSKKLSAPVVVPSAIGSNQKRKVLSNNSSENIERINDSKNEEFLDVNNQTVNDVVNLEEIDSLIETVDEEPVKRKRGRPKKIVEGPIEETPKRRRGRPKKDSEEIEEIEDSEEQLLPGVISNNEENSLLLSEIEEQDIEDNNTEDNVLPGFEEIDNKDNIEWESSEDNEQEEVLPGMENEDQFTNGFFNKEVENQKGYQEEKTDDYKYGKLDIERIISQNQKLVAFVGTSKNGTSFLVNNVAELLSLNGIDTAILDLTNNRNAYYIYTKNEDNLREQSNYIMEDLKNGKANGLMEHKNLTIYTSPAEGDEQLKNVEPIIETLMRNHTVVIMDCDFTTPMRYFKYAQEIYLIQSMDILTIQPLTFFLRKLSDKGAFDESKARVILNKFTRTKELNEELLIGGISIYNDAGMTVRKELFNRRTVKYLTVPFEIKTYLRYLDGLVTCDISLKGYSKELMQSLQKLAGMIYQGNNTNETEKYRPPSAKNNNINNMNNMGTDFSPSMSDTLKRMKQNY